MSDPLRVFIGFDSKEPAAWHVAAYSLARHASRPVSITPLMQSSLRSTGLYTRERGQTEATEFSLTRFLCPSLCDYQGYALFLDCDVLVQADVWDLLLYPLVDPNRAVYCVQHDYIPKALTKFDGHEQTKYPRKNWSSVLLFRNDRCTNLTPEYVNQASGLQLHRFQWTTDDQIGALPAGWNHLVGEYAPKPDAQILHYTNGTPCFSDYATGEHADRWWDAYRAMLGPARAVEQAMNTVTTS